MTVAVPVSAAEPTVPAVKFVNVAWKPDEESPVEVTTPERLLSAVAFVKPENSIVCPATNVFVAVNVPVETPADVATELFVNVALIWP